MISGRLAHKIIKALSKRVDTPLEDLLGERRTEPLALRRAEVAYVLRKFNMSFPEIGIALNRDHTSVIYAVRRVAKRKEEVTGYGFEVDKLIKIARRVVRAQEGKSVRERLPDLREGTTHHFEISDREGKSYDGYIQTGHYEDGRLGEVFIRFGKSGDASALLDQWAVSTSYALQYGVPPRELLQKFVGTRFEPEGSTSNKDIPRCTSVLDYVARWLLSRIGGQS